jgi:Zn-dependent protease with chaperone function
MKSSLQTLALRLLIALYLPFLILLGSTAWLGLTVLCVVAVVEDTPGMVVIIIPLGWVCWQFLWASRKLFNFVETDNTLELRLPRDRLHQLYKMVADLGPFEALLEKLDIRLTPHRVGYVYESLQDQPVLVVGGLAVRALSQQALAGVVAHLLTHLASGETGLARRAMRTDQRMDGLETGFEEQPLGQINPLVWLIWLYHWVYRLVWAAHSRKQILVADQGEVQRVGKEAAAATLLHLSLLERVPYLRLDSIAECYLMNRQSLEQAFAEQQRRAGAIDQSEWREAFEKELDKDPAWFAAQPLLRERLAAMGISPKKALNLLLEQRPGPPALQLFPDWEELEKQLTELLLGIVRDEHGLKLEMSPTGLGRPVCRG